MSYSSRDALINDAIKKSGGSADPEYFGVAVTSLNNVYSDLRNRLSAEWNSKIADGIVEHQHGGLLTLPSDFKSARSVVFVDTEKPYEKPLEPSTGDRVARGLGRDSDQYPDEYRIHGLDMRLSPWNYGKYESGKFLIRLEYYFKFPYLVGTSADDLVLLQEAPNLLLYGLLSELFSYKRNENESAKFGSMYNEVMQTANVR